METLINILYAFMLCTVIGGVGCAVACLSNIADSARTIASLLQELLDRDDDDEDDDDDDDESEAWRGPKQPSKVNRG